MRIRTIKPEFYQSETMAKVSREVRDLAKALVTWSDDEGYFRSHPRLVSGALYPFDNDGPEFVERGLKQLAGIGFVHLFEGGIGFLPGFGANQRINRASDSKLKPKALVLLTFNEDSLSAHGGLTEDSLTEVEVEGKGSGMEVEKEVEAAPPPARDVFEHWRTRMGKTDGAKLNDKRQAAIKARLAEGYTVDQIKEAVDGCALTPHNMGSNDRGEKFNDIELICRTGTNVERFIANNRSPPNPIGRPIRAPSNPDQDFPTGVLNA